MIIYKIDRIKMIVNFVKKIILRCFYIRFKDK
jgi:hypothetical protein